MLRIVSISLLIFLYTLSTCRVFLPFLHYAANKEYYLERCENKAKPELECDGSCQVEKEIAVAADEGNTPQNQTIPNSQRTQTTETIELFHLASDIFAFAVPQTGTISFCTAFDPSLLSGVGTVPFQPPRA
jgi:hypothetical protein